MGRSDAAYRHQNGPPPDLAVARLAASQHGVVATAQLVTTGLTPSAIARRAAAGRLHPIHRGVYAVGHPAVSPHGRWLAAVLACGPGAVLSHRDAAALWGLPGPGRRAIDVTTSRRGRSGVAGIDLHRVRQLAPEDVTTTRAIPVTTIARTLVDLAEVLDDHELARAFHEAEVLRLLDARALRDATHRLTGRHSLQRVHHAIDDRPPAPLRSELERRFLQLCHHARLPAPTVNASVQVAGRTLEVDFLWRSQRLIAETDGAAVHATRRAFEEDRRRDVDLAVAGLRVVRFTWRRVTQAPDQVAGALAALLR